MEPGEAGLSLRVFLRGLAETMGPELRALRGRLAWPAGGVLVRPADPSTGLAAEAEGAAGGSEKLQAEYTNIRIIGGANAQRAGSQRAGSQH